jgi:hypothetical protein
MFVRKIVFALVCLAGACGQTTAPAPEAAPPPSAPAFALESEALIGRWSFDRTCGLYDLVFEAEGRASYFDYSEDVVVSHVGTWATSDGNRVVLTTRVQSADGGLGADIETYNLDVSTPVTDDLVGRFAEARDVNAKRCDETEDRE